VILLGWVLGYIQGRVLGYIQLAVQYASLDTGPGCQLCEVDTHVDLLCAMFFLSVFVEDLRENMFS
jgi:hypothetical protein